MSYPVDMDDHAHRILALQRALFGEPELLTQCLVLAEEVGEVCRVVAKTRQGIRASDRGKLADELADVLVVTLGIMAASGINPDHALAQVLTKLEKRRTTGHYRSDTNKEAP